MGNAARRFLKALPVIGVVGGALLLTGCQDDATIASSNLSKAADNFEIDRRIVFYNGITGDYMLTIRGRCSIVDQVNQLEVTCKTGSDEYKKHFLGLSDNVTYFAEQIGSANVSAYHYRVTFKPQSIVPSVDLRTDADALGDALTKPIPDEVPVETDQTTPAGSGASAEPAARPVPAPSGAPQARPN